MAIFIVTYDLHQHGQNYECLTKKLKAYGTYCHLQRSVWLIRSDQSAVQIRDNLKSCLDSNDDLFVAKLAGEAAWHGFSQSTSGWLKQNL